ncbi:hypothetical protein [Qipengyuania spongiae]|uniref:GlsB/YeaQ/YmgE family stress response membrane protein n=1 Tax=Qipengyuania spongiae TaxID=2909673 RepID=A0ABY5SZX8_9SPHN|nr:hypothetical protein [Qipengyuania spongiae]UVI39794.1 hypothetical protein L1F33_02185 [Qipengyuania spongiae]
MGLLILILIGALLGWVGSIALCREERLDTLVCAGAGTAGALVAGTVSATISLMSGICPLQMLWAVIGALIAIALSQTLAGRLGNRVLE